MWRSAKPEAPSSADRRHHLQHLTNTLRGVRVPLEGIDRKPTEPETRTVRCKPFPANVEGRPLNLFARWL